VLKEYSEIDFKMSVNQLINISIPKFQMSRLKRKETTRDPEAKKKREVALKD